MEKGALCGPWAEPQHRAQELPGRLGGGVLWPLVSSRASPGPQVSRPASEALSPGTALSGASAEWLGCEPPAVSTSHKSRQDWSLNTGHFHAVTWSILWGQLL